MTIVAPIFILLSILLIGFFSGIELAFISANKLSLELNKKKRNYVGKTWGDFAEKPSAFIATMLCGLTVSLVIYSLLIGEFLLPLWLRLENNLYAPLVKYVNFIKLLFETSFSTFLILIVIFFCRAFFKAKNKSIISNSVITYIANLFYNLFSSISSASIGMASWMLKYIFNIKLSANNEIFEKSDVEYYAQQNKLHNEEDNSEANKAIFENALSLREVKLRECLVPRKEIVGLKSSSTIADVRKLFIETQLSKLVVFDDNIDNIIGYIHQLDLFKSPLTIQEILLPIPTVPETMTATDLMTKFGKDRKSIAWVIDEFGGTAGIVTMEDLLEEIFGDIKDEYDDVEEFVDKQLSENEFLFSGRMELDEISKKYGLVFSEDENAETLSGYIVQHNDDIPKEKENIIVGNFEFDIISMSDTRIETVKLKVLRK